jgi:hypothetical protein
VSACLTLRHISSLSLFSKTIAQAKP